MSTNLIWLSSTWLNTELYSSNIKQINLQGISSRSSGGLINTPALQEMHCSFSRFSISLDAKFTPVILFSITHCVFCRCVLSLIEPYQAIALVDLILCILPTVSCQTMRRHIYFPTFKFLNSTSDSPMYL